MLLIEAEDSEQGDANRLNNSLLSVEAKQNMILNQVQRRSSKVPQKGIRTKVQTSVRDSDDFQDFRVVQMESKQDIELLMNKVTLSAKLKNDIFSDSEDEFCTVRDDQEEFSQ